MRRALRFTVSDGDSPSFRPQPIPAPTLVEVADSDSEMSDGGTGSDGDVVMLPPQLDFLEFFSPPRVCFAAARRGLSADAACSLDITRGYDFMSMESRAECLSIIKRRKPKFVVASPPCTMYSPLQALFNLHKMTEEEKHRRFQEADALLKFTMSICKQQALKGGYFAFEHPQRASSWGRQFVDEIRQMPDVHCVSFDQCRTGLMSPGENPQPIKKRTTLMSNAKAIQTVFAPLQCRCPPGSHRAIEGSIDGISLSKWCQHYTPELCDKFAEAVDITLNQDQQQ